MIDAPQDTASVSEPSNTAYTSTPLPPHADRRVNWFDWVREGLRATTLRRVHELPEGPSAWQMLLIAGLLSVLETFALRFSIAGSAHFVLRTWLFSWATTGLLVSGIWLVFNWGHAKTTNPSPVASWFLLYVVAILPISFLTIAIYGLSVRKLMPDWWLHGTWYAWILYAAFWIWEAIASWRIAKGVNRSSRVATGIVICILAIQGINSFALRALPWEPVYSASDKDDYPTFKLNQETFETQQALLEKALHAIEPHKGTQRHLYGLIYAPYSQDVFLRESAMVEKVLEQRFDAQGHIVRLVNNTDTVATIPWATNLNLERSLQALAKAMDTQHDVILIYLTSHGGSDFKLSAWNWPLEVEDLTAIHLRTLLDKLGIQNRVIAVSACYSGGWIEPLKNDNTLVMTAADKDHTSFGCGNRSELTFFGRAVFDEQLRKTLSFEDAFKTAVPIIKQREIEGHKSDGFSNPQIFEGKNIRGVLNELTQQLNSQPTSSP